MNKANIRKLVVSGMLGAITVVLGLTPLGFIPLGLINATTMHIPVIVGGILEGPVVGGSIGLIFGISSLAKALTMPTPVSFVFYNPLISILPRILIGISAHYVYASLVKIKKRELKTASCLIYIIAIALLSYSLYRNIIAGESLKSVLTALFLGLSIFMLYLSYKSEYDNFAVMAGAFAGSMTNTVLVLGGIYVFYAQKYMETIGKPASDAVKVIFGVAITSGIPEAIISILITTAIIKTVLKQKAS